MCWIGYLSNELQSHSFDSRKSYSEVLLETTFIWKISRDVCPCCSVTCYLLSSVERAVTQNKQQLDGDPLSIKLLKMFFSQEMVTFNRVPQKLQEDGETWFSTSKRGGTHLRTAIYIEETGLARKWFPICFKLKSRKVI